MKNYNRITLQERIEIEKLYENSVDVSSLPSGIYVIMIGEESTKFIKK